MKTEEFARISMEAMQGMHGEVARKLAEEWLAMSSKKMELQSRLESLEKDAARWRAATRDTEINDIAVYSFDKYGDDKIVMGDEADSVIDAAMQARKGGE